MAGLGSEQAQDRDAARLYAVAQALTAALTPDDVAEAVFARALADLGASTAGLWLIDEGVIVFAGGAGHTEDTPGRVGPIALDSSLPAAACVRTGEVVAYGSVAERDARWPELSGLSGTSEAVAVLPLAAEGRRLGCLHIGYPSAMPVDEMDLPLLERVAELCAAALHRAQLFELERAQRDLLEFFSDATRVLIRSLDPADVIQGLVDTAVPRLADSCSVLIPEGERLKTVATRGRSAARDSYPVSGGFLASRCFRTGDMQIADGTMVVPIEWAAQRIGVLSLGFAEAARAHDRRLQEMAVGLALRSGVALHNAGMYDAERTVARTLTDALLPPTTPVIPGYEAAVEYLPAAGDVAGDWYDIVDLGGRFLVGVGDAAGHGLPAATLMAELRHAARGLAAAGHGPADTLDSLTALVDNDGQEAFATAIYAVLDPVRNVIDLALAGHPPPMLLRAGRAVLLEEINGSAVEGPPIAPGVRGRHSTERLDLLAGDTLVLFTDGVVERRGSTLMDGFDRLADLLSGLAGATADTVVERIVGEMCADATDDCCVLVLRRTDA